jgi:hypothetical protein
VCSFFDGARVSCRTTVCKRRVSWFARVPKKDAYLISTTSDEEMVSGWAEGDGQDLRVVSLNFKSGLLGTGVPAIDSQVVFDVRKISDSHHEHLVISYTSKDVLIVAVPVYVL